MTTRCPICQRQGVKLRWWIDLAGRQRQLCGNCIARGRGNEAPASREAWRIAQTVIARAMRRSISV
jgi:hypothetical protein